jgi:hypothetical protein
MALGALPGMAGIHDTVNGDLPGSSRDVQLGRGAPKPAEVADRLRPIKPDAAVLQGVPRRFMVGVLLPPRGRRPRVTSRRRTRPRCAGPPITGTRPLVCNRFFLRHARARSWPAPRSTRGVHGPVSCRTTFIVATEERADRPGRGGAGRTRTNPESARGPRRWAEAVRSPRSGPGQSSTPRSQSPKPRPRICRIHVSTAASAGPGRRPFQGLALGPLVHATALSASVSSGSRQADPVADLAIAIVGVADDFGGGRQVRR